MAPVPIFLADVTEDATLVLDRNEAPKRKAYLHFLKGKRVEVIIRERKSKRSLDQNAYLHAIPLPMLAAEWGEDIETTKLLVLGECFGWHETKYGRVPMKPHTAALKVDEMSHLIEWLPPWAMLNFGVSYSVAKRGRMRPHYHLSYRPWHPKATSSGCVYEHVLIAEAALGKHLPNGAHVHHVDGNHLNNAPRNLVICENMAYHKLLHVRTRVLKAGGNPNAQRVCATCHLLKPFAEFNRSSANGSGLQPRCRTCQSVGFKNWRKRTRA